MVIAAMGKSYSVLIEQDEDCMYVGKVIGLQGCVTQGETLEELRENLKEAISLYVENKEAAEPSMKFIGVQQIEIA